MNYPGAIYGEYIYPGYGTIAANSTLRYRTIKYYDSNDAEFYADFCVEVFKKPWFFGIIRKKHWQEVVQTSSLQYGLSFANSILK